MQRKHNHNTSDTNLQDWISTQAQQDLLRFITCGSVDDGKSTLIGRLLFDSQQIFDDQLATLQADSKRHGTQGEEIDFALLVDGLAAEREQGITIDVAYRFFSTSRRKFIVADTPGHEQYTRNMATAASTADVAIILIDARKGILPQTKRHAYIASLMGIRHVAIAVNKMDLIDFRIDTFQQIESSFRQLADKLGLESVSAIPVCALSGDNVASRSAHMHWYCGPTLLSYLETIPRLPASGKNFAFPVQYVNRPNADFRGFSGTVASGQISVGTSVRVCASGQVAQIKQILTFDGDLDTTGTGDAITVVLDREVDASRGDVFTTTDNPMEMSDQFEASLIWMHTEHGLIGRSYALKLANQWTGASITAIKYRVEANTLSHESCRQLRLNDISVCNLALSRPVAFDSYHNSRTFGAFILVDRFSNSTVAAGLIHHSLRRAQNVHRQALSIKRQDRERLNGHEGKVIWFTGLSGSGKSTIANALEKELHVQGKRTYILDGDNIRQGLSKDLGFTDADRVENIRRIAEVSKLMMDAGLIVITAFISPFRAERQMARELVGDSNFIEAFINTPLEICEKRDPKGLYKKARNGQLPNMTGINSPYEAPDTPSIEIDTTTMSLEKSIEMLTLMLAPSETLKS
ncbi:sulfate adenylyltransferase subunit CysN [Delftia acidovorans]